MKSPGASSIFGGPIVITGANGQVGVALRRRLAASPSEIRALTRQDVTPRAFRDAQAVVHLAGTLLPGRQSTYEQANRATVSETVSALAGSAVERVVFLSYVGADPQSENAYLRAKGEAEELLYRSGRDCVVFRCTHIFGPPDDPGPTLAALMHGGDAPSGSSATAPSGLRRSTVRTWSTRSSPHSTRARTTGASIFPAPRR